MSIDELEKLNIEELLKLWKKNRQELIKFYKEKEKLEKELEE